MRMLFPHFRRLVASPEVIPVAVAVDRSAKSRRPPKVGGPIRRPFSKTFPGPRLWWGPRQRAARRQRQKERRKGRPPVSIPRDPSSAGKLQTATPRYGSIALSAASAIHRIGSYISSDTKSVEAVGFAFEQYAKGMSRRAIAAEFNKRGLRTIRDQLFDEACIRRILQNPTYCGDVVAGKHSRGKFNRISADGIICVRNAHDAIVSRQLFETVEQVLQTFKREKTKPICGNHILSTLVHCGYCDRRMYGIRNRRSDRKDDRRYTCTNNQKWEPCTFPASVAAEWIEQFALRAIEQHVMTDDVLSQVTTSVSNLIANDEHAE
jgi:hypothetical protein